MESMTPPHDLIEIDPRKIPKPTDYRAVSWSEITKAYNATWYIDLSVGRVFFRRLGQLARDDVNLRYAREHPEFVQLVQDAEILREFVETGVPLDPPHQKKLQDLNLAMLPVEKMQYLECVYSQNDIGEFIKPLKTMTDLDAFLSALLPGEVDKVYQILREMVTTRPITEDSKMLLLIAQEYGIPVAEGVTADKMSAEMTDALASALMTRGEVVSSEMGRLRDGK